MAYDIIGSVHKISTTENIQTKNGGTLQRRSLTLIQKRFDQNTGEEFEPNFPTFDFTNRGCADLDKFRPGDMVRVRFDISGVKYADRQTGAEKYFNSLRAFRIEPFAAQQAAQPIQGYQQPIQQPAQPQHGTQQDDDLPF